jgi:hypothetical protein
LDVRYSIDDWRLLDRRDRFVVGAAVDRGERVDDPRLRPIAAATASALLRDSGWKILRRRLPVLGILSSAVVLIVIGRWWLLLIFISLVLAALWLAERQARRLRPQWHRAIRANEDNPEG